MTIPVGLCHCGCGETTTVATRNRKGVRKGEHAKFRPGHSGVLRRQKPRYAMEQRGHGTPCWIWQGSFYSTGYGRITTDDGRVPAHRWMYEQRVGQVPDGLVLDHLCRVKACVNPDHLEAVTHAENCRRGARAKLTYEDAVAIRASNLPVSTLAREYGVGQTTIRMILLGAAWTDGSVAA